MVLDSTPFGDVAELKRLLLEKEHLSAIPSPTLSAILSAVAAAKAEALATTDETEKCHNL